MELQELLIGFRAEVKKKFNVNRFSALALATILDVDPERYRKWEKGFMPNSQTDRDNIKYFFQIDKLEEIPIITIKNTIGRLEQPSAENPWHLTGEGKIFAKNNENKNGKKRIVNIPDSLLISTSELHNYLSEALPTKEDSNYWFPFMENVADLKEAIYSGQIKEKNRMLMTTKPPNLFRIPDVVSDFVFEMFSPNMVPKYNPSDRLCASFIEKEMVMFGFAYLIYFTNPRMPASVNYIRKSSNKGFWILSNEDKQNFDDKEIDIEKIHSVYTITFSGKKQTQ